ncbi:thiolase family protein [Curvibacter sp. HBC61]|uniref:Thiolase family protein n=1 Tax=Curvibacter cyanobacteriorum TaxID=3026422 RepID=A0ABT5N456_9BURK|nr:thiolase family protein [Curvibacter sp. HBC61]MDD0839858.1 thiolase family protein [Curvibacter sp. HBC61]
MKALIASYGRTPFHFARKGALASTRPESLAAQAMAGVLARSGIDPALLEDVIVGCAYPEGAQGNNIARIASFLAGLPQHVGGMTLNRFCGSSMSAVHMAAAQIEAGIGEAYLCVGVESMTAVPQGGLHFDPNPELMDRYPEAYIAMGETAENVAAQWGISRADQDAMALQSHQKAAAAQQAGLLADEIIPTRTAEGQWIDTDGCIRPGTSLTALAALRPAFRPDGVVTAGTSSPLTDGAAAVLVVHEDFAQRHGLKALARIETMATYGVDPRLMGIGPIPATRRALDRAHLQVADLNVVEINEAFSAQALACIRDLGLDPATVNIDGGALALGHPLGATGARITGKAASLLRRVGGRYALATQCIGGGQGIATVLSAV